MLTVFNYFETLSQILKFNSIKVALYLATNFSWPLHQMDVKKCISSWKLTERSDYGRDPPPGFMVNGQEGKVS